MVCGANILFAPQAQAGAYDDFFKYIAFDDATRLRGLLLRGMDPNSIAENGNPALVYALEMESSEAFRVLLSSPSLDVNKPDTKGDTPLMIASSKNKTEWVTALLKRGAEHTRAGQWSPLHYAATANALSTIELLVSAGADVNVHSANNSTPLMMAARAGKEEAARLLMKLGADPSLVNDANYNAAGYALRAQRKELAYEIMRQARALKMRQQSQ